MPTQDFPYLDGSVLYGDDFEAEAIRAWFEDEREAYAELGAGDRGSYSYAYHALNRRHGFRYLGGRRFRHALGLGSAYGDEFAPIADRIDRLTVVDASTALSEDEISGVPIERVAARESGAMAFADGAFDLVLAFGVLHHVPNVSTVVGELARCTAPGGVALVREPVISMGDWRRPRAGLTARERGIPLAIFRRILVEFGFAIRRETLCMFPPLARLALKLGSIPYASPWFTCMDGLLSSIWAWNLRYHARSRWHKLRPTNAFFVLERDSS